MKKAEKDQRRLLANLTGERRRERLYDEPLPFEVTKAPIPDHIPDAGGLSPRKRRFVAAYTTHYMPSKAVIDAGYPARTSTVTARALLREPRVRDAIDEIERVRLRELKVDGDYVLARILQIAFADPRSLVQLRVPPCRHCWGDNNEYQRTHAEMETDLDNHENSRSRHRPPFDPKGGAGYDIDAAPNPDCPNCFGRGDAENPRVLFTDTDSLTPEGKALYAGARIKNGTAEVMMRDQGAAMGFLQRFAERFLELNAGDGGLSTLDMKPVGSSHTRPRVIERRIVDPKELPAPQAREKL